MRVRFNEDLLLWAIATLQPASVGDAVCFIEAVFPDVLPLPKVGELEPIIEVWKREKFIVRVHGKSRLYSITIRGNEKLPIRLRRYRDRVRLFLMKSAHSDRFELSEVAQWSLAGASPAVNGSSDLQEGSRPISSDAVPREPRTSVRTYWPRVVKQLDFVGSKPRSPDTLFDYYSFPTVHALHQASFGAMEPHDLSISDLGLAIGISPRLLTSFIHKPIHHYRQFEIGKRGGGTRVISSPKIFLKVVQYWVLDYFLFNLPIHENCHSYRKGHSILTNAQPHVLKRYVANFDIRDFFGSVTKDMVEKLLLTNGIGQQLSRAIARLVTLDNALPQGAPTSPTISNAYLYEFDIAMTNYASKVGLAYTRYADDITLSGEHRGLVIEAIAFAENLLRQSGLQINDKKTRIASNGGQQQVTGVVVNEKPQPPRQLRRRIRAMFHRAKHHPEEFKDKLPQLRGYLSYLQSYYVLAGSVELEKYRAILERLKQQ